MPSYFACGRWASCARASLDASCPGRHLQMSDGVHEITVDGRPLERSVCHVGGDGVVLEDVREDVTPRRDV